MSSFCKRIYAVLQAAIHVQPLHMHVQSLCQEDMYKGSDDAVARTNSHLAQLQILGLRSAHWTALIDLMEANKWMCT